MDQSEYRQWCQAMRERSLSLEQRCEFAAIALHYQLDIEDQVATSPKVTPINRKVFMNERDKTIEIMWLINQHLETNSGPRTSRNE